MSPVAVAATVEEVLQDRPEVRVGAAGDDPLGALLW